MLKVPQLDEMTYGQMMQRAVGRIPGMTDEWTDFNYHDPGITVLSTYAWLADMLNYYMDATGDMHVLKYLKLLGLHQRMGRHAEAYMGIRFLKDGGSMPEATIPGVSVPGVSIPGVSIPGVSIPGISIPGVSVPQVIIPRGMRMYAGDTCFEATETQAARENPFRSYVMETDGKGTDLTAFAGVDGGHAELFPEGFTDYATAYFGFEKALSGHVVIQVCVAENEKRAPFGDSFTMASLEWQYHESGGWRELAGVRDLTNGFLRSGMIHIDIPGPTSPFTHKDGEAAAHYIRCTLRKYTYDVQPKLGSVYVNPFLVEQKRTVSRTEELNYQGESELSLPFYVPENARLMVGMQEGDGKGRLLYSGEPGEGRSLEIQDGGSTHEKILAFPQDWAISGGNAVLQVFCMEESFLPDFRQGSTDGCASQEVFFPYPDLYEIEVSTWTREEDGRHRYEIWSYVPDLTEADYAKAVFTYDPGQKKIIFGDGIHGKVPRQGQQLCITRLSVSELSHGNVLEGEINRVGQEDVPYRVSNLQNASGGRDPETVQRMTERLEGMLFAQRRLVSPTDYEAVIRQTPGLLIEGVTVLSGKRYAEITGGEWDRNEVVAVVKPYSGKQRPTLSEYYREKILEHIEDKRLINTKVTVESPAYVGIEVRGRISLASPGREGRREVISCLEGMIKPGEGGFGKGIILGKIQARLEMLGQVRRIHELSLERTGRGAAKNQRGDILLDERSLSYIKTIDIEFC